MNILILAAGNSDDHFGYPFFLSEIDGIPFIKILIDLLQKNKPEKIIIVVKKSDADKYNLKNLFSLISNNVELICINNKTNGAACSALMAVDNVESSSELLVMNINELLKIDFKEPISFFKEGNFSAAVITFNSVHPRYSYAKINNEGLITEVSEKNPISSNAIAGFFWFKTSDIFFEAIKSMILKDCRVENLFYLSPVLNELILIGLKVGNYSITPSYYIPIKNMMQIDAVFSSEKKML